MACAVDNDDDALVSTATTDKEVAAADGAQVAHVVIEHQPNVRSLYTPIHEKGSPAAHAEVLAANPPRLAKLIAALASKAGRWGLAARRARRRQRSAPTALNVGFRTCHGKR